MVQKKEGRSPRVRVGRAVGRHLCPCDAASRATNTMAMT